MLERILVPLDGSALAECVLPHVSALVAATGVEILLLRVLDPLGASTRPVSVDPLDWQIRRAEAEAYLKAIASHLEYKGVLPQTFVMEGRAAESVIEFADEKDVSLIILSSHGQSGLSGWNVSSVVQKIILRSNRSMLVIRAYQQTRDMDDGVRYQRILIPLDGSQRAEIVLPLAERLARAHDGQLLVVHVVEEPEMPRRTPYDGDDMKLHEQITERNRVYASKYLAELEDRIEAPIETRIIVASSVSVALHDIVQQSEVDLVMLSAHGYTGSDNWPFGSTVISFIAYGTTPLLVMQDMPPDRIKPTEAEKAAKQRSGH